MVYEAQASWAISSPHSANFSSSQSNALHAFHQRHTAWVLLGAGNILHFPTHCHATCAAQKVTIKFSRPLIIPTLTAHASYEPDTMHLLLIY